MSDKAPAGQRTFGIGAVAKLTGLSDHTIRVWERRYRAVVAQRAGNGRRLYTEADVERLSLLKALTDSGIAIGRVANEDVHELRERIDSVAALSASPAQACVRIAALGELLPNELREARDLAPVTLIAADSNEERLLADTGRQPVDVLVVEFPVLGADTRKRLRALIKSTGAQCAVVVYKFAKAADVERLRAENFILIRSPVSADEVRAAVLRAGGALPRRSARPATPPVGSPFADDGDDIDPRRFTQEQIAALARVSSTVECECPNHLAHLVGDLSAFEIYSARCANRDDEDAALHRYLHRTTARARAMIEEALERVVRAEGI